MTGALEFDAEEDRVWSEGEAAAVRGDLPTALPNEYREDWRAVYWALAYQSQTEDEA